MHDMGDVRCNRIITFRFQLTHLIRAIRITNIPILGRTHRFPRFANRFERTNSEKKNHEKREKHEMKQS